MVVRCCFRSTSEFRDPLFISSAASSQDPQWEPPMSLFSRESQQVRPNYRTTFPKTWLIVFACRWTRCCCHWAPTFWKRPWTRRVTSITSPNLLFISVLLVLRFHLIFILVARELKRQFIACFENSLVPTIGKVCYTLPVIGLGHSLGGKLTCLMDSPVGDVTERKVKTSYRKIANIFLAFNNYGPYDSLGAILSSYTYGSYLSSLLLFLFCFESEDIFQSQSQAIGPETMRVIQEVVSAPEIQAFIRLAKSVSCRNHSCKRWRLWFSFPRSLCFTLLAWIRSRTGTVDCGCRRECLRIRETW